MIYLHIGQADLLNKTVGNKVFTDLKDLIQELAMSNEIKICISLIIPLEIIPQVKSVISQVNRETATFISELRKQDGGEYRFFT